MLRSPKRVGSSQLYVSKASHGGYTDDVIQQHADTLRMGITRKSVGLTMSQHRKNKDAAASNELEKLGI